MPLVSSILKNYRFVKTTDVTRVVQATKLAQKDPSSRATWRREGGEGETRGTHGVSEASEVVLSSSEQHTCNASERSFLTKD